MKKSVSYIIIGILLLAVVGMGAYIFLNQNSKSYLDETIKCQETYKSFFDEYQSMEDDINEYVHSSRIYDSEGIMYSPKIDSCIAYYRLYHIFDATDSHNTQESYFIKDLINTTHSSEFSRKEENYKMYSCIHDSDFKKDIKEISEYCYEYELEDARNDQLDYLKGN